MALNHAKNGSRSSQHTTNERWFVKRGRESISQQFTNCSLNHYYLSNPVKYYDRILQQSELGMPLSEHQWSFTSHGQGIQAQDVQAVQELYVIWRSLQARDFLMSAMIRVCHNGTMNNLIKSKTELLPTSPGCYIHKDKNYHLMWGINCVIVRSYSKSRLPSEALHLKL